MIYFLLRKLKEFEIILNIISWQIDQSQQLKIVIHYKISLILIEYWFY